MSKVVDAQQLIEAAEKFIRGQRSTREADKEPAYQRQGLHVILGEPKMISPDFVPSHESGLRSDS